jgi:hypothetical protein
MVMVLLMPASAHCYCSCFEVSVSNYGESGKLSFASCCEFQKSDCKLSLIPNKSVPKVSVGVNV